MGHVLQINADEFVPVDEYSIPYGIVTPVEDTPFDFREPKAIGRDAGQADEQLEHTGGYDHNFALNGTGTREVACAVGDVSGITMKVITDLPGVQFYAGNMIDASGPAGKGGVNYRPHDGFCLETQYFPNSINVLAFESPKLPEGDLYQTETVYQFGVRG
jgi:aldose 1-epimerase